MYIEEVNNSGSDSLLNKTGKEQAQEESPSKQVVLQPVLLLENERNVPLKSNIIFHWLAFIGRQKG